MPVFVKHFLDKKMNTQ